MNDRQAQFLNEFMGFLRESNVNLGCRGTATREAFLGEVHDRIERFFEGDDEFDVHQTSKTVAPQPGVEPEVGPDTRVHKVTPRIQSGQPGGAVEMTQGESMKIDVRAGNTPEMSDG